MQLFAILTGLLAFSSAAKVQVPNAFERAQLLQRHVQSKRGDRVTNTAKTQKTRQQHAGRQSPFLNEKSQKFAVNGSGVPDVDFDIGESYAGLLPISNATDESRQLFFWFFPSEAEEANDEIVVWLNGGPGCSSLSGLLSENGPFTWQAGTLAPVKNPYSWSAVSNIIWIEQPVGTGFTQGAPSATNEVEAAEQFKGFWRNLVETFQLQNKKVFITGESYAGYYCPYIADSFLQENNTEIFNIKGVAINDPEIGDDVLQQYMPFLPFVEYWSNVFFLNQTFLSDFRALNNMCGFTTYMDKFFRFPPPEQPWEPYEDLSQECGSMIPLGQQAILDLNPCFNVYHVTEMCPYPYEPLGSLIGGGSSGQEVYFNRTDVKKAIHAPLNATWRQCKNVFPRGDSSIGPALDGTLTRVIERLNTTIIGSGNLDLLLPTNGTLFALQNMTWNGGQGFTQYPSQHSFVVPFHANPNRGALSGAGAVGSWGSERGLTFYQVQLSGHQLPGFAAGAGVRSLQLLLGRISSLNDNSTRLI